MHMHLYEHVRLVKDLRGSKSFLLFLWILVIVQAPFQQWGLDFIGQLSQSSSGGHSWILVATIILLDGWRQFLSRASSSATIVKFLEDNILTKFGSQIRLQQTMPVSSDPLRWSLFVPRYNITLAHSANYYPQGNGLAESSNKNLIRIIRKIVGDNKRAWDSCLKYALWADRITKKCAIGKAHLSCLWLRCGFTCELEITSV
jgi:hypothetical protein